MCSCCLFYFTGDGPHERGQFSSDRCDDEIWVLSPGDESPVPLAQAQLRLPGDVLDRRGKIFKTDLDDTRDLRRMAVCPRAFDEHPASMTVSRLGDTAEASFAAAGVLAGSKPEIRHQLSGIIEAGKITHFGDNSDGHGEPDAAERLEGLYDGIEPPGRGQLSELDLDMSEAFRVLTDGTHVFLEDDLLGRRRTDDR